VWFLGSLSPLRPVWPRTQDVGWDASMKVALFERVDGTRGLGRVEGDYLVDLGDWLGDPGTCPLATFIERADLETPPIDGARVPVEEARWLPPALGSAAPVCVGVNYREHARLVAERTGTRMVDGDLMPALFIKQWSALTGHRCPIVRPRASTWLDFEGELVVVIGRHCRHVRREEALDVVAGYTIGQDGSVRDWQRTAPTPTAGKNFAHSGALGPWMVTADDIPDPSALLIRTTVNGEVRQQASAGEMIHDIPALIAHVTTFMPLAPGDVIFTGTPAGAMADRGSDQWLQPGDSVAVTISGIGELVNTVVDEPAEPVGAPGAAQAGRGRR
jgi:2-keto-4-pentenoate hydratase/2-oxohepta-3-ene-1,7-dioic acid hydratase in catechol pathway